MEPLQQARWEVIEAGGRTAQSFGLSRLLGQIYVLLYLSEGPQSLDDICQALGVSKASVSIACRQLEGWGAVRRAWKKGDRRDYYEAETDMRALLNNGLLISISKKLSSAKLQIERSLAMLQASGDGDAQAGFLKRRLERADQYRARLESLIQNPILRRLL